MSTSRSNLLLVPPLSFSPVAPKVYRSGFPLPINFPFLKRLKLKAILYLGDVEYHEENRIWYAENGIDLHIINMKKLHPPFVEPDPQIISEALSIILDVRNHPILVHCDKGKHRVGITIGCLRKQQGWTLTSLYQEYNMFAGEGGEEDKQFIECYNEGSTAILEDYKPPWFQHRGAINT